MNWNLYSLEVFYYFLGEITSPHFLGASIAVGHIGSIFVIIYNF
jgi:hypothetical protein